MKQKALALAEHLFEMEYESINNDPKFHWEFYGWNFKYGESSVKFGDDLRASQDDIQKLATTLYEDFKNNRIDTLDYNIYYPENYGNFTVGAFEKHLASLTKVGTQLEILN